jgi:hypothetical protein
MVKLGENAAAFSASVGSNSLAAMALLSFFSLFYLL